MRIAIFDHRVTPNSPVGSCHLHLVAGLCQEHEFVVFASEFANPCPARIQYVPVKVPRRPLVLQYTWYHAAASVAYQRYLRIAAQRPDIVQVAEGNVIFGDIAYVHFCHSAYLRGWRRRSRPKGLRGLLRYLDHLLHACAEPHVFRRASQIVVPSLGLQKEIEALYPFVRGKIVVIPNPVAVDWFQRSESFYPNIFRAKHGIASEDMVLVFVALGHFERKGLEIVLKALHELGDSRVKLWVVGGPRDLVREWRQRAKQRCIENQVQFWGFQSDIRPFLWAADAFILPSEYETFSLASVEAAAAGLPLIVTPTHVLKEFVRDGENGFLVERSVSSVAAAVRRLCLMDPASRQRMGRAAQTAARRYSPEYVLNMWRELYNQYSIQLRRGAAKWAE